MTHLWATTLWPKVLKFSVGQINAMGNGNLLPEYIFVATGRVQKYLLEIVFSSTFHYEQNPNGTIPIGNKQTQDNW